MVDHLPDTAEEAQHVAVDPVPLGPQLYGPQGEPEVLHIRHLPQYLVRHAATVQTAHTLGVQILQQHRITQVLRICHLLQRQPGKGQVYVNAVEAELDDGHKGVGDGAQVRDLVAQAQMLDETGEVVLAEDVTGRHTQRVNVRALVVHAEAVGAEGVDLAAHRGGNVLRHTFLYAYIL